MTQPWIQLSPADEAMAAAIQYALLNQDVPTCTCGSILLRNRMVDGVGGDFYFFRQLGQDQVAFAIGDVMGHGAGAALLMSLILGLLRGAQDDHRRPCPVIESINRVLLELGEQMSTPATCSLIYAVVDLPSGVLLYVNAGHPHPVIVSRPRQDQPARTSHLPPTTMLLGVDELSVTESCHQFDSQDRVVLFTDGLSEARNGHDEMYTERRLRQLLGAHHDTPANRLADLVFADVDAFHGAAPHEDDQTLVILDFDAVTTQFAPTRSAPRISDRPQPAGPPRLKSPS